MHPAIIIGTVRSLIVDVAMGQIPRSTERISSFFMFFFNFSPQSVLYITLTVSFRLTVTVTVGLGIKWR